MKLRKSGFNFQFLDDEDQGDFLLSSKYNNFELVGHAVDNILYVTENSQSPQSLAVTTRGGFKRSSTHSQILDVDGTSKPDLTETSVRPPAPISKRRVTKISSASPSPNPPLKPATCSPEELWHLRLGHASKARLSKISSIKSTYDPINCIACIRAKQHKQPFYESVSKTTQKGQLIHSDLAGPFITSKGKSRYVLTLLDDYTHYV